MISSTSRYANASTQTIQVSPTDLRITIVPSYYSDWAFNFTYYQVKIGDRVDTLARFFYVDDTQWWRIANANPEILDWTKLTPGQILRVPSA
jgi:hypothetical protein